MSIVGWPSYNHNIKRNFATKGEATYLLKQQALQLITTLCYTQTVRRVHHPDQRVGLLKVVSPVGPYGLLAAHIPDVELVAVYVRRAGVARTRTRTLQNRLFL